MEQRTLRELYYNNRLIELKECITFYSDGSYKRKDGIKRYGNTNGKYLKMSLYDIYGREHKVCIHTLMLCIFVSDRSSQDYEVDHIDRNVLNNNVSNLRWVNRRQNLENRECCAELNGSSFINAFNASDNIYSLSYDVVHHRVYNLGWSFKKAMNTPLIGRGEQTKGRAEGYERKKTELRKWFDKNNKNSELKYKTFYARVRRYGMTKEDALVK